MKPVLRILTACSSWALIVSQMTATTGEGGDLAYVHLQGVASASHCSG